MYTTTCCIEITPLQLVIYCVMTDSVGKDWLYRVHIASYVCGNNISRTGGTN